MTNMNNSLNARAHRTAVIDMFRELKELCDNMNAMLSIGGRGYEEEVKYAVMRRRRDNVLGQIKRAGLFL